MKKLVLLLSLLSTSIIAAEADTSAHFSIGVGMGAPYGGLGANLAYVSETDMKYISLGCVEYSSLFGSTCGVGGGWIMTDLFAADSNKHGFGVYVVKAGTEIEVQNNNDFLIRDENQYYGVGLSYTYFLRGINVPGFSFGVSVHATNAERDEKVGGFLQVGYQF